MEAHIMITKRPKNLDLFSIRLPVPALVSILHRISGLMLYLAIPFLLLLLQASLRSEADFDWVRQVLQGSWLKCLELILMTAFAHHFFAGMRHLAMDVRWISGLAKVRRTSKVVLFLDVVMAFLFVWWLW